MRRRGFLGVLARGLVAAGLTLGGLGRRLLPVRVSEALRGARYPGALRRLRARALKRPGRWAG